VEDLSIYTEKSAAISVDKSVTNIVQCRFENLIISPGGPALDLDPGLEQRAYTQNTLIRNVHVARPGGPALTMWGNANHVEQVNTEGGTREGFSAEPAIVTISGIGNDIRSCTIEANDPNPAVAFHLSGHFTWSHNWVEISPVKDHVAYIFRDVEGGQIDYLHHILPWHKARFENAQVLIRTLNLDGELSSLAQNLELDERSSLRIDQVIARTDAGMLDDPRVSIGSVYNKLGRYRVDLPLRSESIRLLTAPAAAAAKAPNWSARWKTPAGIIRGSMRIEDRTTSPEAKLRVEITENAPRHPLTVETTVDVPDELIGREAIITWRIEGPGQVVTYYAGTEIPSRAMGSRTANPLPSPVKKGDVLQFILPPEPGVYFLSDVALHPR
jgi:hypothetical protein